MTKEENSILLYPFYHLFLYDSRPDALISTPLFFRLSHHPLQGVCVIFNITLIPDLHNLLYKKFPRSILKI